MSKLDFKAMTLDDYERVYRYMSSFGEGSCHHSFVTMYSYAEKYGDQICVLDDTLYTFRKNISDDEYRVYLAPMGKTDAGEAFRTILQDAASYGEKAKFFTLTESKAEFLREAFPGRFLIEEDRDYAEYIFPTREMSAFPGGKLKKRRVEVNHFWNLYGDRAKISVIQPSDHQEILAFEDRWLNDSSGTHDMHALEREYRMIRMQLHNYDVLHLSGVVLRNDGDVKGFGYGTKISDRYYDAIVEKGDRSVPHIYKVLRMESVRQCAMDCEYVNMEEDLGVPGLREIKSAYKPAFLLHKYMAAEGRSR